MLPAVVLNDKVYSRRFVQIQPSIRVWLAIDIDTSSSGFEVSGKSPALSCPQTWLQRQQPRSPASVNRASSRPHVAIILGSRAQRFVQ